VVEMTVTQYHCFDLFKSQTHPANVAFQSIGIGTGVKENRSLLCA
jgi:hypothetical protein